MIEENNNFQRKHRAGHRFLLVCLTLMVIAFVVSMAGTVRYSLHNQGAVSAEAQAQEAGGTDAPERVDRNR